MYLYRDLNTYGTICKSDLGSNVFVESNQSVDSIESTNRTNRTYSQNGVQKIEAMASFSASGSFDDLCAVLASIVAPFWSIRAPFWHPFGRFGLPFGTLLLHFCVLLLQAVCKRASKSNFCVSGAPADHRKDPRRKNSSFQGPGAEFAEGT